jgi:hypothetical protein
VSKRAAALGPVRAAAKQFQIGSLGMFYCSQVKGFTTPFLVTGSPDMTKAQGGIWAEEWYLPFGILPLGSPRDILEVAIAVHLLPTIKAAGTTNWTHLIHYQPTTSFRPTTLTAEDWAIIVEQLVPTP